MREWTLYIDETGTFDQYTPVAIGGLLVDHDTWDLSRFEGELRRNLEEIAPHVTWPLHAAHVNLPVFHVLAKYHAGDMPPQVVETVGKLRAEHNLLVENAFRRMDEGRRPYVAELKTLDRTYRQSNNEEWHRSQDDARLTRAGVRRVLRGVATSHGVQYFAAGETTTGDAYSTDFRPVDFVDSRYGGLLRCTIRRVLHVLEGLYGEHALTVTVLSRGVKAPNSQRLVPMTRAFVEEVIRSLPGRRPRYGMARATAGPVVQYDDDAHPMFVLTDFAANGTLRECGRPNTTLKDVENRLNANLGVAVRGLLKAAEHQASLSFLSASGMSESWASWAVEDGAPVSKPVPPTCPPGRRWAVEQAQEWVDVF